MFREHSVKTPAAEAGKRDKPASQAVPLEQGQVHSLLSLASQEEEEEEEKIKAKCWTGTRGSSCPQGEVALAVAGGRGKPPLRPTSTTGKQLLLKICAKTIYFFLSGSLVLATYSTWEAIFLTVAVVVMATMVLSTTITTGGSTTTMEDSTTTMEDFTTTTTMVDFTITTMEALVRVSRVITDANASTASHSATGIWLSYCYPVMRCFVIEMFILYEL